MFAVVNGWMMINCRIEQSLCIFESYMIVEDQGLPST
jgi:hypothetical protein